jgi:hypothetical protein
MMMMIMMMAILGTEFIRWLVALVKSVYRIIGLVLLG